MAKNEETNSDEANLNLEASMRFIIIDGMALENKVHKGKNMKTWKVILIEYLVEPKLKQRKM